MNDIFARILLRTSAYRWVPRSSMLNTNQPPTIIENHNLEMVNKVCVVDLTKKTQGLLWMWMSLWSLSWWWWWWSSLSSSSPSSAASVVASASASAVVLVLVLVPFSSLSEKKLCPEDAATDTCFTQRRNKSGPTRQTKFETHSMSRCCCC